VEKNEVIFSSITGSDVKRKVENEWKKRG